jgi:dihydrofolate reductase
MRSVTYSMSVSLDGYIVGPDGDFNWSPPDEEVFRLATDEVRGAGVHLLGRRLYEAMLYWETVEQSPAIGFSTVEFASLWKRLPKVVFLRAEPGEGDIAIGGAGLAAQVAAAGLIDEYRARVYPVLVGGGIPFFPQHARRVDLEPVETRTFSSSKVVYLRYRVAH